MGSMYHGPDLSVASLLSQVRAAVATVAGAGGRSWTGGRSESHWPDGGSGYWIHVRGLAGAMTRFMDGDISVWNDGPWR